MTQEERIQKLIIKLILDEPFFGSLIMNLRVYENNNQPTFCTNGLGLWYNSDFAGTLNDEQVSTVLVHEILHCLTPESMILTEFGFKSIKDINIGEKVYSHRGGFTKVIKKFEHQYKGDTYTFKSRFGIPITFTNEHPILSLKQTNYQQGWGFSKSLKNQNFTNYDFKFLKAEQVDKNDALTLTIPSYTRKSKKKLFRTRDHYIRKTVYLDEEIAYFIGFFVGDGSLHKEKSSGEWFKKGEKFERVVSLTLSMKDNYQKLLNIIKTKFFRSPYLFKIKNKNAKRILFSAKSLSKFLRREFYNKEGNKQIPIWLLNEKENIIKAFLNGLQNADGSVTKNGRMSISNTSVGVYSFIPLLLLKLNIPASFSISKRKEKNKNHNDIYRVSWETNRKNQTSLFKGNKFIFPLDKKIKNYYNGLVYNLETENHTFCVPFFTTHNCALAHMFREKGRDHYKWNVACDYAVNNYIEMYNKECEAQGRNRPFPWMNCGELLDLKLNNKSSEEIYNLIKDIKINKKYKIIGGFEPPKGNQSGDSEKTNSQPDEEGAGQRTLDDLKEQWKNAVISATMVAKGQGHQTAMFDELVNEVTKPSLPWEELLRNLFSKIVKEDYSWSRVNRKYMALGYTLPSLYNIKLGKVYMALDTSGSMDENMFQSFFSNLCDLLINYNIESVTIIQSDADLKDIKEYSPGDSIEYKVTGRGGTDFRPVFKYLDTLDEEPLLFIYFTDLMGDFPEYIPAYNTVWAVSSDYISDSTKTPFGEIIPVKDKE